MTKFKAWMKESTIEQKRELAEKAETSLSLLYQLSYGTRKASSGLASRIEKASTAIAKKHKTLPELRRGDLSEDCANCKLYKECSRE